jgi:lipoprotein signal peptidase
VLPWFFIIGSFLLIVQRRWRESAWEILVLFGPAVLIGLLLLITWDMSAHRVFSINLLLAACVGLLYDRVFCQCQVIVRLNIKYPLFIALYGQLFVFLLVEKAAIGT